MVDLDPDRLCYVEFSARSVVVVELTEAEKKPTSKESWMDWQVTMMVVDVHYETKMSEMKRKRLRTVSNRGDCCVPSVTFIIELELRSELNCDISRLLLFTRTDGNGPAESSLLGNVRIAV